MPRDGTPFRKHRGAAFLRPDMSRAFGNTGAHAAASIALHALNDAVQHQYRLPPGKDCLGVESQFVVERTADVEGDDVVSHFAPVGLAVDGNPLGLAIGYVFVSHGCPFICAGPLWPCTQVPAFEHAPLPMPLAMQKHGLLAGCAMALDGDFCCPATGPS